MREERVVEDGGATCERLAGEAVVDLVGRAQAESTVPMFVVVPVEEAAAVIACILHVFKAIGEAVLSAFARA